MKKSFRIILLILLILLVFGHKPILTSAGNFLAPTSKEPAEVLILEGTELAKKSALKTGMTLLSDGMANRMVVVLHEPLLEGRMYVLPEKYPQLVIDELVRLGLKKEKTSVISAPISSHPITISEARFVTEQLARNKIKSAILVGDGFHTRRSYYLYKQEGEKTGIHVFPYAYFTEYKTDSWWRDIQGINDFFGELVKLSYYFLSGHLSINALWN